MFVVYTFRSGFIHMLWASGSGAIRSTVPTNCLSGSASTVTIAGSPRRTLSRLASWTSTSATEDEDFGM